VKARTTTTPAEAAGIILLCFGWFIVVSMYAVSVGFRSGSFSEAGLGGMVALEVVLGVTAAYLLASRGFDIRALYPSPSFGGAVAGLLLAVAAGSVGQIAIAPLDPTHYSEPLERLMSGSAIGLPVLVLFAIVNGAYEEVFLLGFLLRGLRGYGLAIAIGVSLLVRVLYHLYQGPLGAVYVAAVGAVFSITYVATGRLFPAVLAHALWDIVPFVWHAP
jgi:uncharacterized protein